MLFNVNNEMGFRIPILRPTAMGLKQLEDVTDRIITDELRPYLKAKEKEELLASDAKFASVADFDKKYYIIQNYFGGLRVGWFEYELNPRTNTMRKRLRVLKKGDFIDGHADKRNGRHSLAKD